MMTDVFISYSRQDRDFVHKLCDAFQAANRQTWVDWNDIPPTAEWLQEIYRGIESADTVVCVLSPGFLTSKNCRDEILHAIACDKRLVPIVCRSVTYGEVEEMNSTLASRQWISFQKSNQFSFSFDKLIHTLDTDLEYEREKTRLLVRALEWTGRNQSRESQQSKEIRQTIRNLLKKLPTAYDSALLRGSDVENAQNWLIKASGKEQNLAQVQTLTTYITASRRASNHMKNSVIGVLAFFLMITSMLTTFTVISRQQAIDAGQRAQQQKQFANSRALAAQSSVARLNSKSDLSLLLGVKASQTNDNLETRDSLLNTLTDTPYLDSLLFADTTDPNYSITGVTFSADGQTILGFDSQGRIIRWDVTSQQAHILPAIPFKHDYHFILQLALSPDGHQLAFTTPDGLWLWNIEKNAAPTLLAENSDMIDYYNETSLAFSSNGSQLFSILSSCPSSDCTSLQIQQWNISTQKETSFTLHFGSKITTHFSDTTALSPDGKTLAITCNNACNNRVLQIWDISTEKLLYTLPADNQLNMTRLQYSANGNTLVSISCPIEIDNCSFLQVWDLPTQHFLGYFTANGAVSDIALSQDGRYLVSGGCNALCEKGQIEIWDLLSGKLVSNSLTGHIGAIKNIAFSSNNYQLVSSSDENHLILWNLKSLDSITHELRKTQLYSPDASYRATLSPNWKTLVEVDHDRIYVENVTNGKPLTILSTGKEISRVAFSPTGKFLAAVTQNTIFLWNMTTQTVLHVLKPSPHQNWVFDHVVFSSNEHTVAATYLYSDGFSINAGLVDVWDVPTGNLVREIDLGQSLTDIPYEQIPLTLSPDGKTLAISHRTSVFVWNVLTGEPLKQTLNGHHTTIDDIVYSPDGHTLASLDNNGTLILWDIQTGKPIDQFTDIQQHFSKDFGRIFFSPNGALLAITNGFLWGNGEDFITLWDVKHAQVFAHEPINNGLAPLDLGSITHEITTIMFSLDSTHLAWVISHYNEGAIYIRDLTTVPLQIRACQVVNRNLTTAEWNQFIPAEEPYHHICPDHATSPLAPSAPSTSLVLPTPTATLVPAPIPPPNLYTQATSGSPILSDSLYAQDRSDWTNNQDQPIGTNSANIVFTNGALHISSEGCGGPCEYEAYAQAITFQNLTIQVQMTFITGQGSVGGASLYAAICST